MRAKFRGISKDYENNKWIATLNFEDNEIVSTYQELKDRELNVEIKNFRKKRSLDANSYYWVCSNKLAAKLHVSNESMHNMLLRRYGAIERIDGSPVTVYIPDTDEAEEKALNASTYHIKPTSQVKEGQNGTMFRAYLMIKGSHEYNTEEMSRLIDGVVAECKEVGIETLPPYELERIVNAWRA